MKLNAKKTEENTLRLKPKDEDEEISSKQVLEEQLAL
jgi:hypothetical protein